MYTGFFASTPALTLGFLPYPPFVHPRLEREFFASWLRFTFLFTAFDGSDYHVILIYRVLVTLDCGPFPFCLLLLFVSSHLDS